jgi:hypothetical protein
MSNFSSFNLSVEKTAQIETAKGRPSGTAVITIATASKEALIMLRAVSLEIRDWCSLSPTKIN